MVSINNRLGQLVTFCGEEPGPDIEDLSPDWHIDLMDAMSELHQRE